ncbi:MAG: MSCRAMM family adhesin SdrC [Clostridiales bacterium]|nr:MSCRAMM family adhesin SdrC [Clostridiales bacterium]
MDRHYAALPYEYLAEMEELDDEEFGRLCRGLLRYSMDGTPIAPEGNLRFFSRRVMGREDRFREHFEAQRRQRAQAGKKGAETRWGKPAPADGGAMAEDGDAMAGDGKHSDTDTDTKADADTNTKPNTDAEAEADPNADTGAGLLPAVAGETDGSAAPAPQRAGRPTREQVFDFIRETGLNVDGERFWSYYQARDWLTRRGRPVDWRRRAEQWAETQWSPDGQIVPLRPAPARQQAENRASLEEMRRALEKMRASG